MKEMDYGLVICQANGRPIMTEHLNKRFKDILTAMNDPEIDVSDIVFHSIRHTSAGVKLRLSNGDLKAVQGDGGWSTPDMVTKRYAHILDEDRRSIASQMEERFHCFGCQADGDVIDFTAELFDMNNKGAAVKLTADFGIPYEERTHDPPMPKPKPKISAELQFRKTESYCYRVLCDYLRLLEKWQTDFAPRTPDEEWHPLFVEALQRKNYVEYLLDDVFLTGSVEDKAEFIRLHGKDVTRLEKRI